MHGGLIEDTALGAVNAPVGPAYLDLCVKVQLPDDDDGSELPYSPGEVYEELKRNPACWPFWVESKQFFRAV